MTKRQERYCEYCKKPFNVRSGVKECSMKCKLLNRSKKEGNCLIWTRAPNSSKYGRFNQNRKNYSPHRASYETFNGEIPNGYLVLHKCDNPRCINPKHLFLGTHKENTHDMMKKDRMANFKGENNSKAILTENQVLEIRKLHSKGMKTKEIANLYNVKYYTCLDVVNRRNWRHI
jgi:HNH endonuclease